MKRKIYLMCVMIWGCLVQNVFSQGYPECDVLYCNTDFHVSVGENCEREITPEMLIGYSCILTNYQLTLTNQSGDHVPNPVTIEYVNQTITAELIAWDLDDTCTTNIVIDDKIHPVIDSVYGPGTLTCLNDLGEQFTVDVTENCDYSIEISNISISGDGNPLYTVSFILTVTDIGGNQDSRTIVRDLVGFWDIIQWPPDYFAICEEDLVNAATPIITIPPDCPREVIVTSDEYVSPCQINRLWTVTDVGTGLQTSKIQSLSFYNNEPLEIIAEDVIFLSLKEFNAGWEFEYDVVNECNTDPIVYVSREFFRISCDPEYFKIIYSINAEVDCGTKANHQTVVIVKAKKNPKIKIKGKKSCYEPFIIRTVVENMTPPFQYDYTVNNFNWGIVDLGFGRARVYPGKGKVVINVKVTDQVKCTAQDKIYFSCNKFVPFPFSAHSEGVIIYPNPSTGKLFISGEDIEEIMVYNIEGRLVKTFLNFTRNQVDISDLDNGIYIAKIKTSEEEFSQRLIKI